MGDTTTAAVGDRHAEAVGQGHLADPQRLVGSARATGRPLLDTTATRGDTGGGEVPGTGAQRAVRVRVPRLARGRQLSGRSPLSRERAERAEQLPGPLEMGPRVQHPAPAAQPLTETPVGRVPDRPCRSVPVCGWCHPSAVGWEGCGWWGGCSVGVFAARGDGGGCLCRAGGEGTVGHDDGGERVEGAAGAAEGQ